MKKAIVSVLLGVLGFLPTFQCFASGCGVVDTPAVVIRNIGVSYSKTTVILFPSTVLPVDVGSEGVMAEKVDSVANVLKIKAAIEHFAPTNLTALTADGGVYSFNLFYDESPITHVIDLRSGPHRAGPVVFTGGRPNEKVLNDCIDSIADKKPFLRRPKEEEERVVLRLSGIYYYGGFLYLQLLIENNSKLPYEIDFTRSSLKDAKQVKRTAIQRIELKPYVLRNDHNRIEPDSTSQLILAYPQFTIGSNKRFHLEVFERNGGRHLALEIKASRLLKVKSL